MVFKLPDSMRTYTEKQNKIYARFCADLDECLGLTTLEDKQTKKKHVVTICPNVDGRPMRISVWLLDLPQDSVWVVDLNNIRGGGNETVYFHLPIDVVNILNVVMEYFRTQIPRDTYIPLELKGIGLDDLDLFEKQGRSYYLEQLD
jgi:hypothetical protein